MKNLLIIFAVSILFSCEKEDQTQSIVGKWDVIAENGNDKKSDDWYFVFENNTYDEYFHGKIKRDDLSYSIGESMLTLDKWTYMYEINGNSITLINNDNVLYLIRQN